MKNTIPNSLRKHRRMMGLRQIDVAHKLGLKSSDRISHWEKGLSFPHPINLFKLGLIYNTTPGELYADLVLDIKYKLF